MTKGSDKVSKTYRLTRRTVGLLEQYAREEGISQTEGVERAIKHLCRVGNAPATQQDISALYVLVEQGFKNTQEKIQNQPIQALAKAQEPKKGIIRRFFENF